MPNILPTSLPTLADTAPYIVIGSGVAGLYTALELCQQHRVILITKTAITESNTAYAQGGIASALGGQDSPELHYQDTIMAGAGLCNNEAVLTLVHEGPEQVYNLIQLGTPFDRKDGEIALTREAAHSRPRILHADGDATGREISRALIAKVRSANITIYENHFACALVTRNRQCCGVVTLCEGQSRLFLSSATILCTGGLGQIYGKTTNPAIATGEGMSLAYQAGAALQDLEFVQFHPTALVLPPAPPFLISETVRGEGAILLNQAGERFMPEFHPLAELAPRDVVARAIFSEITRSASASVFLDLSRIPKDRIRRRFPNIYDTCLKFGLDITSQPIPVAPAAHYFMGGIVTDLNGRTRVPGLYAAGEAACTGVHGANRLASNSLLEGLVFGSRATTDINRHPLSIPENGADLVVHYPPFFTDYATRVKDYAFLRQLMDQHLGIVRHASGLTDALTQLETYQSPNPNWVADLDYLELQNMFFLAKMMFQAALTRTESRGGHYRSDYPEPSDSWRKHIRFCNSTMEVI